MGDHRLVDPRINKRSKSHLRAEEADNDWVFQLRLHQAPNCPFGAKRLGRSGSEGGRPAGQRHRDRVAR